MRTIKFIRRSTLVFLLGTTPKDVEFNIAFVSCPVYTHTPTAHVVLRMEHPRSIMLPIDNELSPTVPLKRYMSGLADSKTSLWSNRPEKS